MISVFDLNQYDEEGPDNFGEEPPEMMTCQRCGGEGISSDCIDDLCNGQECIHGDDSTCRECGGDGEVPCPLAPPSAPAMRRGGEVVNRAPIAIAKREALRFLDAVKHLELVIMEECRNDPQKSPGTWMPYCSAASGRVRRASMDLTRALAEMRKP